VSVLPLAIGAIVDETPGVRRSQLIQTDPITMRLRLDPKMGVDVEKMWGCAIANLKAYLLGQGLANVEVVRASEPAEQSARSGKFRQVIARSRGAQRVD
jgi:phenylacetate-CoA ligase